MTRILYADMRSLPLTDSEGIWMIDFGKTIETDSPITHTAEWNLGNHEDGYLFGLETITRVFGESE